MLIFAVALLSSVIFAYLWIDRSISLGYMEESFIASEDENQYLLIILNNELKYKSNREVIEKLEKIINESPNKNLFKYDNDYVWFGDVKFEFKEGRLREISG